jgi:hypothetical protein
MCAQSAKPMLCSSMRNGVTLLTASKACKLLFDQAASGSKMIKWGAWVEKAKKGEGIDLDATHVLKVIAPLRAVLGVEDE